MTETISVSPLTSAAIPLSGSARERLLAAAETLFYEEGLNSVGIERVIERAGVAKASLYSNFGSKDELVRSYLEARFEARKARVQKKMAQYDRPRDKLLSMFDLLGELFVESGFRGCAFVRARTEARPDSRARGVCDDARQWTRELFTSLASEAGASDPALLAGQLVLLYDGASVSAQMDGNTGAALAARDMASRMLDAAVKK